MNKRPYKSTLLFLFVMCLFAYFGRSLAAFVGRPISAKELVGVYEAKRRYGLNVLTVNANGTYHLTTKHNNGKSYTDDGKWSVKENYLWLDNVTEVDEETGIPVNPPVKAIWPLEIGRQFFVGHIVLPFDTDGGDICDKLERPSK